MKAIRVSQTGGPDVLSYEDVEVPALSPSGVLVKIEAAGINYIDTYQRSGLYPVKLPFTPGPEGAGTGEHTGDKADGVAAGAHSRRNARRPRGIRRARIKRQ